MFELSCFPVDCVELRHPEKGESLNGWFLFAPAGYVRLSSDRLQTLMGFLFALNAAAEPERLSYGEFHDSPCGACFGRWWYHLHTRTKVPVVDHFVPSRERDTLLQGSLADVPGLLAIFRRSLELFHRDHSWRETTKSV